MSRVSDTRQRTREAATQLVAAGKRPHEITVDLIYAEIQQGSRTTINDELKAWKDERTKADALGADLPPAIADSMRLLWVAAVEQGEQVFLSRRAELETALENAQAREAAAIAAHDVAEATGRELAQRIEALQEQSHDLQRQLGAETAARKEAQGLVQALQEQLTAIRVESARQLEVVPGARSPGRRISDCDRDA
jgi:DNA-binding ferritin-like protein (Dps family)